MEEARRWLEKRDEEDVSGRDDGKLLGSLLSLVNVFERALAGHTADYVGCASLAGISLERVGSTTTLLIGLGDAGEQLWRVGGVRIGEGG